MHQGGPQALRKVLIANRGEIAVRIARACRDQQIASVGIYANSDRDAPHVSLVDEAFSLNGDRAADTYLDSTKILDIARRSGADAVHPGYGFLAENADFAQAVLDAGLTWIGPSPTAIEALGDKVSARQIAQRVGAPLVAGTPDPVANEHEVITFAQEHGLPIAIKAAFGGGGRGLKVAHTIEDIPELYSSAVREAVAAFGRGECFVERFLHQPRHVETQCLADQHGNVVVVSTRDCSLQRRHQKLVEEAPAPFLTPAQETLLRDASVAIMKEANYVGAGTCEFLIGQDGTISFLEVNTRLQVEHTITEEISGIDLVVEQLRIASGEELGYTHVTTRGHSLEFRINGEDPYAHFLPQPGTISALEWPSGPGVRVDAGVKVGNVISGAFDSMVAKIIVTGPTRQAAIARARRALGETVIEGLPTVIPFHRAVLDSPDFNAEVAEDFKIYTTWIESEFLETLTKDSPTTDTVAAPVAEEAMERVVVEVGGKRIEVVIPASLGLGSRSAGRKALGAKGPGRSRRSGRATIGGAGGDALTCPMQGTIVKVAVADGQEVAEGELIAVLEAMKMEQPLTAHKAGKITGLRAAVGDSVSSGTVLCTIASAPSPAAPAPAAPEPQPST